MKYALILLTAFFVSHAAHAEGYNNLYGNQGTVVSPPSGDYFYDQGMADRPRRTHDHGRSLRLQSDQRQSREAIIVPQPSQWQTRQDALRPATPYQKKKEPFKNYNPSAPVPKSRLYQ